MVENDVEQTNTDESPSDQQNNDELTESELEERRKEFSEEKNFKQKKNQPIYTLYTNIYQQQHQNGLNQKK